MLVAIAHLPCKWHHMMLAEREHLNILYYDQFIMIFMKHSAIDQISNILLITLGEE